MTYPKLREQVLERDQYTCQICNKQFDKSDLSTLDTHHIIPKRHNGLDSINNLTSVCEKCHGLIELKLKLKQIPTKRTVISVSEKTHKELCKIGKHGESFEHIIQRLIEEHFRLEGLEK